MRNPFDVSLYLVGNILEGIFIQLLRFDLHEEKNEFLFEFRESRSFYDAIYTTTSIDFSWMERIIGIYYLKIEEKYGQF